jgi:hypothetical protein
MKKTPFWCFFFERRLISLYTGSVMKINTQKILLALLFVGLPGLSFAQIGLTGETGLEASADAAVDMMEEISLDTTADVNTDSSLEVQNTAGVNVETNTEANLGAGTDSANDTDDESLQKNEMGIVVRSSADVNTESDLDVFAHNYAATHEGISRVDVMAGDMMGASINYKSQAQLLGFIPVRLNSRAWVEKKADGNIEVQVRDSWLAALSTRNSVSGAELKSRLESSSRIRAKASANATAKAKAELVEALSAEVAAHASASTNTEAEL